MPEFIFAYITCENAAKAEQIGSELVAARLAACANIYPGSTSIYRWKGVVQKAEEALLVVKTRGALFAEVEEKVRTLHSYETPCILSFAIENGSAQFLEWMKSETVDLKA